MDTIEQLIAVLNGEDRNEAEEAAEALRNLPAEEVVPQLLGEAEGFDRLGRLLVTEVLAHHKDPTGVPLLVAWLEVEDDAVRMFSAYALESVGMADGVTEPLERAYRRSVDRGTPPHWSEPSAFRSALLALGARAQVIPDALEHLAIDYPTYGQPGEPRRLPPRWFRAEDLPEVIDALVADRQVIVGVEGRDANGAYERTQNQIAFSEELDFNADWDALVKTAAEWAAAKAKVIATGERQIAEVSWLDESDR